MSDAADKEALPHELALMRPLDFLDDWLAQRPDLAQYDWFVLSQWEGATSCRMALESILSNALDEKSPFQKDAIAWLKAQLDDDNQLALAVILWEAQLSTRRRVQIGQLLFAELGCRLHDEAHQLWTTIHEGGRFGFSEAIRASAHAGEMQEWQAMPPLDRDDLLGACRRLWRDAPDEETLIGRASSLIETTPLDRFPYLCRQVARVMGRPSAKPLRLTAMGKLEQLAPALAEFLTDDCCTVGYRLGLPAVERYQGIFELAQYLAIHLAELRPETRRTVAERLLESKHPWVLFILPEVRTYARPRPRNELVRILMDWALTDTRDIERDGEGREKLDELMGLCQPRIHAAIRSLTPNQAASLLSSVVEQLHHHLWAGLNPVIAEIIRDNPLPFARSMAGLLKAGKVHDALVLDLVELGCLDHLKEELAIWLGERGIRTEIPEQLARDYLIPTGMALGACMTSIENIEALCQLGYELRPEDVSRPGTMAAILRHEREREGPEYPTCRFWQNEQWRGVMLFHAADLEVVLRSLFSMIGERPERVAQLDEMLDPYWETRDGMKAAVVAIAWGGNEAGWSTAQTLLLRGDRLTTWMSVDDRGCMISWFGDHSWVCKPALARLLTPEEQRRLVYDYGLDRDGSPHSLPGPEGFEQGFNSQVEKEQLARWLLQHHQRIHTHSWLSWVRHLGLLDLPGIGNRIRRRIMRELDSIMGDELKFALRLLRPEPEAA